MTIAIYADIGSRKAMHMHLSG